MHDERNVKTRRSFLPSLLLLFAAALTAGIGLFAGCQQEEESSYARAFQATHRTQLVGGPGALGEVGDWVMENDQIRIVIQDLSFNRGTGLFGGSLIDADLVRHDGQGDPFGGNGRDTFGEIFPAFFLEVIDPQEIVVVNDGADGEAAIIEVRGDGGEFVTMLRFFNQAMINAYDPAISDILFGNLPHSDKEPWVQFTARYILEPGAKYVRIETEMENLRNGTLTFPNSDLIGVASQFLPDFDLSGFTVPTGSAIGFGAANDLFIPGLGYDIRFGMEDVFRQSEIDLPALPGHLTDVLATSSTSGISYGYATAFDEENNFAHRMRDHYGDVDANLMLFLFEAAGYGGAFTHGVPEELGPGETFTAVNYFLLGSGDVASIRDQVYELHGIDTQTVTGRVYDETTAQAVGKDAYVFIYEAADGSCRAEDEPTIVNQAFTRGEGYFQLQLPPGQYCHRGRSGAATGDYVPFEVSADEPTNLRVFAPSSARVEAFIVDTTGNPIPAKMTIVGEYDPQPGLETRQYLFELMVGERWRTSESVNFDPDDLSPRQFIENIEFSSADGHAAVDIVPGQYTAYFSRGAEYSLVAKEFEVGPNGVARLNAQLDRQINPDGYLSGDFHMHAEGSIDSGLDYNDRVISIAGEGVEVVVASDHNFISDYTPYIHRNQLQPFLRSIIGLELTTMEAGHFNAFPLRQDITSQSRGSVAWQNIPPQEIFDNIREMGSISPEDTIIQVNHPRDSILGYFSQHYVDALTGVADLPINTIPDDLTGTDRTQAVALAAAMSPSGPAFVQTDDDGEYLKDEDGNYMSTFSYNFDAIEVYNGKRLSVLRHFRMPPIEELSEEAIIYLLEQVVEPDEEDDEWEIDLNDFTDEEIAALLPTPGAILCDGDDVAVAGGLDDWYNFLNYRRPDGRYLTYTATGNSDSHHYGSPSDTEPGYPKNYFWVGHNDPQRMTSNELVDALKSHHNIVTNGPFINMRIDGQPIGSTVVSTTGTIEIELEARAADWVVGDKGLRYTLVANGEFLDETIVGDGTIELTDRVWTETITVDLDELSHTHFADGGLRDTWFVLEVEGDNNMFPAVQPAEIPPVPFDEALGVIAEPFGFGGTIEGLEPSEMVDVTPLAFTNPIWVIDDSAGEGRTEFEPPEPPKASCVDGEPSRTELRSLHDYMPFGERRLDAETVHIDRHAHDHFNPIQRELGELRDVRALFNHWHEH